MEREVKLQAAPGFHLPDLNNLVEGVRPGPEQEGRMETTYYDTADLRLARWGLSLRHRQREGWTLKLPGSSNGTVLARGELAFDGSARRPPPEVMALLRAYVRGAPVQVVARLSTLRRRVSLFDADGRRLAEVVDDEVSVLSGRRVAARFREVEVELGEGGDGLLQPLLWALRGAGAGLADPTPKYLRALGPAAYEPPEVAARDLGPLATGADVIAHALATSVAAILEHDPGIRLGGEPEDVHQARVGTRRLRSHLRTFGPLLDTDWADGLRVELGWLAGELGALRDQEVLLERLRELTKRLPAADVRHTSFLSSQLEESIAASRKELLQALDSQRYVDLLERLVAAANRPEVSEEALLPATQVLPGLARRSWRRLRTAVEALGETPADEELHQCRILAKRARYAAEAVAPSAGPETARFAKRAAGLQTVLGDHQDSVTAQGWLRAHAGRGRRAYVAGELAAMELVRAEDTRRAWPAAWKKLKKRRLRSWMTDGA